MPPQQCAAATAAGHQCTHTVWEGTLCGTHRNVPPERLFANLPPEQQVPPRPRCAQCNRLAIPEHGFCAHHENMRPRPDLPAHQRCIHPRCMRARQGQHNRCMRHEVIHIRRQQRMVFDDMYMQGLVALAQPQPDWRAVAAGWRAQIGLPFVTEDVVQHLELNMAREFRIPELWNLYMGGHAVMNEQGHIGWRIFEEEDDLPRRPRRLAPAPPRGELEAFTRDGQNVHTRVVTEQTNAALQILLNTDVPSDQRTLREIHMKILDHVVAGRINTSLEHIAEVDRDAKRWYRVSTCRLDNDYLYKRVLDGLWAKMKTLTVREELEIRLWQEMLDSVSMCCDGHISRLTNVLCGFDEAFAPELSPAEKLQNRMSVIAAMEGGLILQVAHAMFALKELNVPTEQWEAWIDAL